MKRCLLLLLFFLCFLVKNEAATKKDSTCTKLHFGVSVSYMDLWIPSQKAWKIDPSWSSSAYMQIEIYKKISFFFDFGFKQLNLRKNGYYPWYFIDVASLNPYDFNLRHNRLFFSSAVSYKYDLKKANSISLKLGMSIEQIISGTCNYYWRSVLVDSSGQPYITDPIFYSFNYKENKNSDFFSPQTTATFFTSANYKFECFKIKPTIELMWSRETKNIGSNITYAEGAVVNPGYSDVYHAPNYFQLKLSIQLN